MTIPCVLCDAPSETGACERCKAEKRAATPGEGQSSILNHWGTSGQPSVNSYNYAVDVANATHRLARGLAQELHWALDQIEKLTYESSGTRFLDGGQREVVGLDARLRKAQHVLRKVR